MTLFPGVQVVGGGGGEVCPAGIRNVPLFVTLQHTPAALLGCPLRSRPGNVFAPRASDLRKSLWKF